MAGANKLHQLNLFKLVLSDKPASVTPVAARLAPKTRRMSNIPHAQLTKLLIFKNTVPSHISHGNLCCWDQEIVLIALDVKQILFKLWQLAGANQRLSIHHIRDVNFGIPMYRRVLVQHELYECPMQARYGTAHYSEARPRDFTGHGGIDLSRQLTNIDVI